MTEMMILSILWIISFNWCLRCILSQMLKDLKRMKGLFLNLKAFLKKKGWQIDIIKLGINKKIQLGSVILKSSFWLPKIWDKVTKGFLEIEKVDKQFYNKTLAILKLKYPTHDTPAKKGRTRAWRHLHVKKTAPTFKDYLHSELRDSFCLVQGKLNTCVIFSNDTNLKGLNFHALTAVDLKMSSWKGQKRKFLKASLKRKKQSRVKISRNH